MLMAISLAEKLGSKHNLAAFSVHPGLVMTGLGNHLKLFGESDEDMNLMSRSLQLDWLLVPCITNAHYCSSGEVDRMMGNAIGWMGFDGITASSAEVGANTYVYAAFDPEVTG